MKIAILAVTNDLVTDQRANRTALTLLKLGYKVTLAGRSKRNSQHISERSYQTYLFNPFFQKGPFFYAEYNIRLFLFLLFSKAKLIVANDLDALPACFFASKLKGAALLYDSHEYFTEVPELENRPFVRAVWSGIEKEIFPSLKHVITVSEPIADAYRNKYGIPVEVIRNFPFLNKTNNEEDIREAEQYFSDRGGKEKKIVLYQGVLNKGRGLEHVIDAMTLLDDYLLVLIGDGDIRDELEHRVRQKNPRKKVVFTGKKAFEKLPAYSRLAGIGLAIEEPAGLNYKYSLSNKLFDYIHAGVPVLASRLPEVGKIFNKYDIGMFIENHEPEQIAAKISEMFQNENRIMQWKKNMKKAAEEFCWEKEEKKLMEIIHHIHSI